MSTITSALQRQFAFASISATLLLPIHAGSARGLAPEYEAKPASPAFEKFTPIKAPRVAGCLLRPGDRLAICGDSITEQKMYSRIMETYLTTCYPDWNIEVRQYGWSGETAEGFRHRMTNDCLRFHPTIATTCYGMNDYRYRPYDEANARWYRSNYTEVVRGFTSQGARVILGSPGCVGKVASWVKSASGTLEEHNLHLCALRNLGIEMAQDQGVRFADNFWPMFTVGQAARTLCGPDFEIAGKDGVHPGWAGQLVMAYNYLRAMGMAGDVGTLEVNLRKGTATASEGHAIENFQNGTLTLTSRRYPFCAQGSTEDDNSIRAGMRLVPFNQILNRYILRVKGLRAAYYRVSWGEQAKVYSAGELSQGVNLADDFVEHPLCAQFKKVDEAVAAKQAYETKQVKEAFHSKEARENMGAVVAKTEAEREPLVRAVRATLVPIRHTITIQPE